MTEKELRAVELLERRVALEAACWRVMELWQRLSQTATFPLPNLGAVLDAIRGVERRTSTQPSESGSE